MTEDATLWTVLLSVTGALTTAGTAVWRWGTAQLAECKQEHRESRARIEELHEEIKTVTAAVGELKGELTAYKNRNLE